MSFGRSYDVRFDTLYGQPLSEEDLRQDWESNPFRVAIEETFVPIQPGHIGWKWHRCSRSDYWGEEWYPTDEWHAEKIVRPSYAEDMSVKIIVNIAGKRFAKNRLRPVKWV